MKHEEVKEILMQDPEFKLEYSIIKIKELRDYWNSPERGELNGIDAFNMILEILEEGD